MADVAVFSDLDRTLVYSPSALLLAGPDEQAPRLLCVEVHHGRPLSFVTERAAEGIARLTNAGVLVPVTTRTPAQCRRIRIPGAVPKFALAANGGRLLREGEEDLDYSAALAARLDGSGAPFEEVWSHVRALSWSDAGRVFVEKVRRAEGLFCYLVVNREDLPDSWIEELAGFCAERGWVVSVQGRKVYCLPVGLSKADAMREIAAMLGVDTMLAAGDSALDRDLLEAADRAIRPAHGDLAEVGWTARHLDVTRAHGVAAGEEIVDWMVARAIGSSMASAARSVSRSAPAGNDAP